jgi:hypothetical protein
MSLRRRQRTFVVGLACAIPLVNVAIWIGVALRPPPPRPPVVWSLPRALLSALTPSLPPSAEPSAVATPASMATPSALPAASPGSATTASSAAPRPVRPAAPTRYASPHREIVDPWGGS